MSQPLQRMEGYMKVRKRGPYAKDRYCSAWTTQIETYHLLAPNPGMERKGPHKSMHCKFCKPPGTASPEKPSSAQLETKTKLHLCHQLADLKVFDVFDEPGEVPEETDACICQLEGYEPCPKCAPDKKRKPKIKAVCDCPLGSRPHANMAGLDKSNQKKKKKKDGDDEFWWEKYDREHDLMVKETWAAYLAQRKEDKKLTKCRAKEGVNMSGLMKPKWYQKLSCQQAIYLEYLSTAIRLDLDENISDRTFFVLEGIGFHPRPKKKVLQKCLRYCRYNTIRFLDQLSVLLKDEDPYRERVPLPNIPFAEQDLYAWNDRILMACICHLEFPNLLREIIDRLPPLPQAKLPTPLQKPKYPRISVKTYGSPYEEPLWKERMNWVEKQKFERLNRARDHLNMKRVPIPGIALVRRPSLIDARPSFLSQIEASQSFHRKRKSLKKKTRIFRKKEKPTFDSKVDMTAIAGIVASEVSTTPKADIEELCVFLRSKESKAESVSVEEDKSEDEEEEIKVEEGQEELAVDTRPKYVEGLSSKSVSLPGEQELLVGEDSDEDSFIFVGPPQIDSDVTLEESCLPPKGSPGPPASHYVTAKRELGLVNQELCAFDPKDEQSNDNQETAEEGSILSANVEDQLKQVVQKLKELHLGEEEEEEKEDHVSEKISRKKRKKKSKKKFKKGKIRRKAKADATKHLPNVEQEKVHELQMDLQTETFGEYEGEMDSGKSSDSWVCKAVEQKKNSKVKGKKKKRKMSRKRKTTKDVFLPCKKKTDEGLFSTVVNNNHAENAESKESRSGDLETTVNTESNKNEGENKGPSAGEPVEEDKIFYGNVEPLLRTVLKDLNDEGFISAGYAEIEEHPDIKQLIKHLQGEIVTHKTRKRLHLKTRRYWRVLEKTGRGKAITPDLNISQSAFDSATWNDKNWISNLAKRKKDEFYFKIAKNRSNESKDFYLTLFQEYFGTERFLKSYYAYMIPTMKECIMKGLQ